MITPVLDMSCAYGDARFLMSEYVAIVTSAIIRGKHVAGVRKFRTIKN